MSIRLLDYNAIFFHIPKTGGTWVHHALENSGIKIELFTPNGFPHSNYEDENIEDKYTFAFVRHPMNWYKSYWCWRIATGWEKDWQIDIKCRNNNFTRFIQNVVEYQCPFVTRIYDHHIGFPKQLTFVGKQENLANDLVTVLNHLEVDFDEKKLRKTARQKVSLQNPACPTPLYKKLMTLESAVLKEYKYAQTI